MSKADKLYERVVQIIFPIAICFAFVTVGISIGFIIRDYQYRDYVKIIDGKVVEVK